MPRSSPAELADLTPFAQTIRDWMWSQRPPMTVAGFAAHIGVPKTTVWGWFRGGRLPIPTTLDRVAARTSLPIGELYDLCGYSLRLVHGDRRASDPYAGMIAAIQRDKRMSPETKQDLIDRIQAVAIGEEPSPSHVWNTLLDAIGRLPVPDEGKVRIGLLALQELDAVDARDAVGAPARRTSGKARGTAAASAQRDTPIEERPTMIMDVPPGDTWKTYLREVESRSGVDSHSDSQDSQLESTKTDQDTAMRSR